MMTRLTLRVIVVAALSLIVAAHAADAPIELHYSPQERLDLVDAALIGSARNTVDIAAYTLTSYEVADALRTAAARGVVVRVVVDPRERVDRDRLGPAVEIRTKFSGSPLMHLKAFAVDGEVLRTGSANFSHSGETQQDNDLLVIHDRAFASKFEADFARMWDAAQ
jgi:phosphatidylserine/phosphatidylglycerophosphate/cardiolipin synthase-like enzyme